jgi:hypothetical protein
MRQRRDSCSMGVKAPPLACRRAPDSPGRRRRKRQPVRPGCRRVDCAASPGRRQVDLGPWGPLGCQAPQTGIPLRLLAPQLVAGLVSPHHDPDADFALDLGRGYRLTAHDARQAGPSMGSGDTVDGREGVFRQPSDPPPERIVGGAGGSPLGGGSSLLAHHGLAAGLVSHGNWNLLPRRVSIPRRRPRGSANRRFLPGPRLHARSRIRGR